MQPKSLAYASYIFISIVWGTTYLAIRYGVIHYPPFLFAGIRQVIAGLLLALITWMISRKADLSLKNILWQLLIGFLMISLGNGLVTWSEQYVPSGVAALICATMPFWAVLSNISTGREKASTQVLSGMLLGLSGVAFIFIENLSTGFSPEVIGGIIALFIATASWAIGSVINKNRKVSETPIFNSGLQLLFGGAVMLLLSPLIEDYNHVDWYNTEGILALLYLIVFGSILAFAAYIYALKELPVGFVTSYAYINPLVAVILGYYMLGEPLNIYTFIAFALIALGIFIVNRAYRKKA